MPHFSYLPPSLPPTYTPSAPLLRHRPLILPLEPACACVRAHTHMQLFKFPRCLCLRLALPLCFSRRHTTATPTPPHSSPTPLPSILTHPLPPLAQPPRSFQPPPPWHLQQTMLTQPPPSPNCSTCSTWPRMFRFFSSSESLKDTKQHKKVHSVREQRSFGLILHQQHPAPVRKACVYACFVLSHDNPGLAAPRIN